MVLKALRCGVASSKTTGRVGDGLQESFGPVALEKGG